MAHEPHTSSKQFDSYTIGAVSFPERVTGFAAMSIRAEMTFMPGRQRTSKSSQHGGESGVACRLAERCTIGSRIRPAWMCVPSTTLVTLSIPGRKMVERAPLPTSSLLDVNLASRWLAEMRSPPEPPHRAEFRSPAPRSLRLPSPLFVQWEDVCGAFLPNSESKFSPRPDVDPCGYLPSLKPAQF